MVPNASTFILEIELNEWFGLSISLHAILRDTTPHSFAILDGTWYYHCVRQPTHVFHARRDGRRRGEWAAGWHSDSESPIVHIVFVCRVTPAGDAYLGSLILPVDYGSLTNDFAHHSIVLNVQMETIVDDEKREATIGYIPRLGSYIALWLDPVRMAECVDDPHLTAVASELTPHKYIAYVNSDNRSLTFHFVVIRGIVLTVILFLDPPPVETEETSAVSEIVANPGSPVPPIDAVNVQEWLQAVDCSEDQDGTPCPHEDVGSEDINAAITTEDDRMSTLNSDTDTEYSDSVDSDSDTDDLLFNADSDADTDAIVEAVLGSFRAKVDDIDVVPLVKFSFDLTEGGECADPRRLIWKARDGTLGDPRAATLDGVVLLAQDVADGTTTEPGLVHDAAHTNVNTGNPITEHPLNTMETAVECSVDMPPESSPESKGETALMEVQPF
ncbi:predicted protein [Postia placenta Mad-698-R]|nr:predicted protein [Postia placenta Mad-698-R]